MVKKFAIGLAVVFVIIGVLNFFVDWLDIYTWQAIFHIVVGAAGLYLALRNSGGVFVKWVGIIGLILSAVGFLGIRDFFGFYKLSVPLFWFYLVAALLSIWVYLSGKNGEVNES